MLFMKVEIFDTQTNFMPLSFSNFDFLPIYKADSAGSRTYPFTCAASSSYVQILSGHGDVTCLPYFSF